MTHAISVPTPFTDIAELAENFAQRVDEERVMLPNHEPVAEGEWVQFTVSFGDGSPALAGTGRCTGSYDNGEDREPEHRFDVVMDSLELDEMGQVYFERILMVRAQQLGAAEPGTGEVEVQEVAEIEASFAPEQQFEEVTAFVQAPPEEAYAEPSFEEAPVDAGLELPSSADVASLEAEHVEVGAVDVAAVDVANVEGAVFGAEAAFEAPPAGYDGQDAPAFAVSDAAPQELAFAEAPVDAVFDEVSEAEVGASAPLESGEWQPEASQSEASQSEPSQSEPSQSEPSQPAAARSARGRSDERLAAPVYAIYQLPPPAAPGQLPSPHENEAVLTRRLVEATWTPTPMLRPDPSPSSGYFQYGTGGLPQPAQPPRPAIDPSLRIVPAPRPGDPLAAPLMRSAFDGGAAVAYADDVHEEAGYEEPAGYEEAGHEAEYEEAGGYEEPAALAEPAFETQQSDEAFAHEFDGEPMAVDAIVDGADAAFVEAPSGEPIAVDELDDAVSFEVSGDDEPR